MHFIDLSRRVVRKFPMFLTQQDGTTFPGPLGTLHQDGPWSLSHSCHGLCTETCCNFEHLPSGKHLHKYGKIWKDPPCYSRENSRTFYGHFQYQTVSHYILKVKHPLTIDNSIPIHGPMIHHLKNEITSCTTCKVTCLKLTHLTKHTKMTSMKILLLSTASCEL